VLLLVQGHKLVSVALPGADKVLVLTTFDSLLGFFGFVFSGKLKRPSAVIRKRCCDFEVKVPQ